MQLYNTPHFYSQISSSFKKYRSHDGSFLFQLFLNSTSRQKMLAENRTNRLRVGNNALSNRLNFINGTVGLDWLNLSFSWYKIKCKRLFLWGAESESAKIVISSVKSYPVLGLTNCRMPIIQIALIVVLLLKVFWKRKETLILHAVPAIQIF